MPLIKSVSGIRGTIGGKPGENLTPLDIVAFTSAFGEWLKGQFQSPVVVIGRDGRLSGDLVSTLVSRSLQSMGIKVIDTGLCTTPSVEMYVPKTLAHGGIIITASHNPREWNAMKFLNSRGEFISQEDGEKLLDLVSRSELKYAGIDDMGKYELVTDAVEYHVGKICSLPLVDVEAIRQCRFHAAVDCVNSTGAISIPVLLDALGCTYTLINADNFGEFAHNPEPLESHLNELCAEVRSTDASLGIAVDPDVDRLALVDETGKYFGEEYTLVAVADYILGHTPGPAVSNLSSSLALRDVALKHGQEYGSTKVGEVHVVEEMKRISAVIGGEGNGGVIYPQLHYGRDALVGIALILSLLAESGRTLSQLKAGYPSYAIAKDKISLSDSVNVPELLDQMQEHYPDAEHDRRDGLKIMTDNTWIHLRASNTEPVIRIYAESSSPDEATLLVREARGKLLELTA